MIYISHCARRRNIPIQRLVSSRMCFETRIENVSSSFGARFSGTGLFERFQGSARSNRFVGFIRVLLNYRPVDRLIWREKIRKEDRAHDDDNRSRLRAVICTCTFETPWSDFSRFYSIEIVKFVSESFWIVGFVSELWIIFQARRTTIQFSKIKLNKT